MPTPRSIRSARLLVAVMTAVVVCFLLATGISQYLERSIAQRVTELVDDAMPSVELLTNARGSFHRLGSAVESYGRAGPDQRLELLHAIADERRNAHAAIARYLALPTFSEEPALIAGLSEPLDALDRQLDALESGRAVDFAEFPGEFDRIDQILEKVATFDAEKGQRLGRSIGASRAEAQGVIVSLDGLAVLLAIAAVGLSARQLHQVISSMEVERRVIERRADELGLFAGRVAHDLLNPIQTASLSLELARQDAGDPGLVRRTADRGLAALRRGHQLIDALLAFARAGGSPEAGAQAEVGPVIAGVLDGLSDEARAEGIALTVRPIPAGKLGCSAGILISLVSNLVRNAIRYMGDGLERRIEVSAFHLNGRWRVEVNDTGPGIPPGQEQRIFEPYVQLTRGSGGIGLGLATVKRLVSAHGGAVGVTSAPGRGCRFWFELPSH